MDDFSALIEELAAWRVHRDAQDAARASAARRNAPMMSKALEPAPSPKRAAIAFGAHPATRRVLEAKAARASIEKATEDMAVVAKSLRREAAKITGEHRAELRAQVRDVLNRAMERNAAGAITAIEVARIEAACGRVLARLEPGPVVVRGAA